MLVVLISALFCLGRDLLPQPAALLAALETNASLLALGLFVFVSLRVQLYRKRPGRSRERR